MEKVWQKVLFGMQVKGIATNGNSDRGTSGKPAFLGGRAWAEKEQ